jgi:SAM-dependent methyltransferase
MNRFRFWWSYLFGMTRWDTGIVPPEIVALADRLPAGQALDLGCGTGTSSFYLAQRGWRVTGIDFIPAAIHRARQKARAANRLGQIDFHVADVTHLDFLPGPFDLAIDVGCLHSLPLAQQQAYAANLARLTRPGATYVLYAFAPHTRSGRRVGLTPDDVAQRFAPAFTVESVVQGLDQGDGPASAWYTLRRGE